MLSKASRLLRIYARLKRGPVTIEVLKKWTLHAGIEISERQLYRDLREIETSIAFEGERIVVYEGEKNRKTWKIEFATDSARLNTFDINSFYLFKNFAPLALLTAREISLHKIETLFYVEHSRSSFERNAAANNGAIQSSHFYEFPYPYQQHKVLEDCIWAIQNKRKLVITQVAYDHTSLAVSTTFPLKFLPLSLLYHRGCIHLCGLTAPDQKLMLLALEQLVQYETTNEMFDSDKLSTAFVGQLRQRFGVTENMDDAVHAIQIEFSGTTGDFVKNHFWHPTQRFEKTDNGNWLMHLHCGINRELVGWIFQWMSNAKVHAPELLRKLVEEKLRATLHTYTSGEELYFNNVFRHP